MAQSPGREPEWSPVGDPPHRPDRSSTRVVVGLLTAIVIVGGALLTATTAGSDDGPESPFAQASPVLPTAASPRPDAADNAPTSPPGAEPSALPTDGGPGENEYVTVARRFVRAVEAGNCKAARRLTDDIFDAAVGDANLCGKGAQQAVRDDDLHDYAINFFGTFGAAVQFDGGRTYINLVATDDGPRVQALITY